jgi:transketolase
MPSTNVFDRQDQAYKDSVLTPGVKRIAVEAGVTDFWRKYDCSKISRIMLTPRHTLTAKH